MTKTRKTAGPLDKLVKRYARREVNLKAKRERIVETYTAEITVIDRELADIREILDRLAPQALKAINSARG